MDVKPVAYRWPVLKLRGQEWRYSIRRTRDDSEPLYDQAALDAAVAAATERLRIDLENTRAEAVLAVAAARADERERCAVQIEVMDCAHRCVIGSELAYAIRKE